MILRILLLFIFLANTKAVVVFSHLTPEEIHKSLRIISLHHANSFETITSQLRNAMNHTPSDPITNLDEFRQQLSSQLQQLKFSHDQNSRVLERLLLPFASISFSTSSTASTTASTTSSTTAPNDDPPIYSRGTDVLIHLVRDWTVDVAQNDYSHLLDLLDEHEQRQLENRAMTTVLVPGSGLGRLAYEILKSGRKVEALDSSISMIAATRTIVHDLLRTKKDSHEFDKAEETLLIYPFVDQTSNLVRHQYRTKKFELLTRSDRHVLTTSSTGTGKTNKILLIN